MDCYIRSYNEYVHEFKTSKGTVVVPSIMSKPKNIVKITIEQFNELSEKSDEFKALLAAKKHQFVKLDSMPRDALDADERIAEAGEKVRLAKEETENAKKEAARLASEKAALEAKLDLMGGIDAPVDKMVSDANAERDKAIEEAENLRAELAALKAKKGK
jgi:chromosome segregation ATPase